MIRTLLLVLLATPAAAQDLAIDPAIAEACRAGDAPETCLGAAAEACFANDDITVAYSLCFSEEFLWWQADLDRTYAALTDQALAEDRQTQEAGGSAAPVAPALRAAESAWEAWRDAQCTYDRIAVGGGTGANPAEADCLMRLTAERALRLDRDLIATDR